MARLRADSRSLAWSVDRLVVLIIVPFVKAHLQTESDEKVDHGFRLSETDGDPDGDPDR